MNNQFANLPNGRFTVPLSGGIYWEQSTGRTAQNPFSRQTAPCRPCCRHRRSIFCITCPSSRTRRAVKTGGHQAVARHPPVTTGASVRRLYRPLLRLALGGRDACQGALDAISLDRRPRYREGYAPLTRTLQLNAYNRRS